MNVSCNRSIDDLIINLILGCCTECLADVAFVIDNSGSIGDNDPPGGSNWLLIINFVKSLVRLLHVSANGTHVGSVDFGEQNFFNLQLLWASKEGYTVIHIPLQVLFLHK